MYTDRLGLDFINRLKTASYNYIGADPSKNRRDGLIAQDVQAVSEELGIPFSGLIVDDDAMKTLNLSYESFIIPVINSVKELVTRDTTLSGILNTTSMSLNETNTSINTLSTGLNNTNTSLNTINTSINTVTSDLANTNITVSTLSNLLSYVSANLENLSTTVNTVSEKIDKERLEVCPLK